MDLVGRHIEIKTLDEFMRSKKAEFMLIYGRRRVGKTYLIKSYFRKKKANFFYVTGIKDGLLNEQLAEFSKSIGECFYNGAVLAAPDSWLNAFEALQKAIESQSNNQPIVLFMDEFPWMATRRSRLIQALEYYWNKYWVDNKKIKLIICGSSAAWIVKKILYQKGGLHNRITKQIILKPFNLLETAEFLTKHNFSLSQNQILQIYLAFGGVPFYLEQLMKSKSLATNINDLCFKRDGVLYNEVEKLFMSLFEKHEDYLLLMKIINSKRYGIARNEITKAYSPFYGGRLSDRLEDLELAGFITSFLPVLHEKRGLYYRVTDEFCSFYLRWVEQEKLTILKLDSSHKYWNHASKTPEYVSWAGYAYESICYKHIKEIKKSLEILDNAKIGSWRYSPKFGSNENGAQIDLLFDQSDSIILCEIKLTKEKFHIDKSYAKLLKQKMDVFKFVTRTRKELFLVIISANGLKENSYSKEFVSKVVTLSDLFV